MVLRINWIPNQGKEGKTLLITEVPKKARLSAQDPLNGYAKYGIQITIV